MLTAIMISNELSVHQQIFESELTKKAGLPIPNCKPSFRSDRSRQVVTDVFWIAQCSMWCCFRTDVVKAGNRWWNVFGFRDQKPQPWDRLDIAAEICIPFERRDRQVAGGFAADDNGFVYVVHSGRTGGGKLGARKADFIANFPPSRINVVSDGSTKPQQVIVVGRLGEPLLLDRIKEFAMEASRYRDGLKS